MFLHVNQMKFQGTRGKQEDVFTMCKIAGVGKMVLEGNKNPDARIQNFRLIITHFLTCPGKFNLLHGK